MATADRSRSGRSPGRQRHPLEPLSAEEIRSAVAVLRSSAGLAATTRFVHVSLDEPDRAQLASWAPGHPIERRAAMLVRDRAARKSFEVVVSLDAESVVSMREVGCGPDDGQIPTLGEECQEAEQMLRSSPAYLAALGARGITDITNLQIDVLAAGNFGAPVEQGRRLARAFAYWRSHETDNGYAHPVEGLVALVDLDRGEIVEITDAGGSVPRADANFTVAAVGDLRTDLRALEITQPEGASFTVDGNEVSWQGWHFRVSMNWREGLVLHELGYDDHGRKRSILQRASIAEMAVPYADPSVGYYWRAYFDAGEYGLGRTANSLVLGCDCLGLIHYFDAVFADEAGEPQMLRNAVCLHEEDYNVLWKHADQRIGLSEVRRSRRLVISFWVTIGNYDYGFYWYLYQDGTIQFEAKLTGIVIAAGDHSDSVAPYRNRITAELSAPHHQHLFCARLDFAVDGSKNAVVETEVVPAPGDETDPYGYAFTTRETLLERESQAVRDADPLRGRFWSVVNRDSLNALGDPVAFRLLPQAGPTLLAAPGSAISKRAAFATHHLWVTRYAPDERFPGGELPNQHPGGDGLPAWVEADRPIVDEEIVVWHTFGPTHLVRPEDWPVMPVDYCGFVLKPYGFFDSNPSLDVPPSMPRSSHGGACCSD